MEVVPKISDGEHGLKQSYMVKAHVLTILNSFL